MQYKIITDAKDDLNIVLDEILKSKRPSQKSLDQLEHVKEQLEKELNTVKDENTSAEIIDILNLINSVLKIYQSEKDKLSSVKIREETKIRLNKIANTYDEGITKLLDLYDENQ